jgi:hypothetical protein
MKIPLTFVAGHPATLTFGGDGNHADIAREYSYMRRVTAMVSAAAVVLWAATAFAQAKPGDFTGKWTREAGAAPAGGGGGGAAGGGGGQRGGAGGGGGRGGGAVTCGMTCDIVASATSIKITQPGATPDAPARVWTCTLDGKDCSNEQAGRQGAAPTQVVSKAKWDGGKIVVTRTQDMGGNSVTLTSTMSVEGGKLMISSTNSMQADAPPTVATYTKG